MDRLSDREANQLLAAEDSIAWLRSPHVGYAYLRWQWFSLGARTSLTPYSAWDGTEVLGWGKPRFDLLKAFDPKYMRVRVFYLDHSRAERMDGFDRWCDDRAHGRIVDITRLHPGLPALPPVGIAYVITAAQRIEATKHRDACREHHLRRQRCSAAPPETKPVQEKPKPTGWLSWMRTRK